MIEILRDWRYMLPVAALGVIAIVAVGLGIMTNPGPTQVFYTTPTSEMVTRFPLALVPTFLVPLAFILHVISLWQLLGGTWARQSVERRSALPGHEFR